MKHSPIVPRILCAVLVLQLTTPGRGAGEASPAKAYSHEAWQAVLLEFVDPAGLVDYATLAKDREDLDRYLGRIAKISPESHPHLFPSRNQQLAYYLNAYNALVFEGVLSLGPDADTVWGWSGTGYGFFVKRDVVVGGRRTNLRALENKDVRERFADPRIHAALNCASLGCPRLPREAFDAETLDRQLDAAATELVSDPRHCRPDPAKGIVTLSKIFDWFRSDFESDGGGLIDWINRYRGPGAQVAADLDVEFFLYDKGLNRQE